MHSRRLSRPPDNVRIECRYILDGGSTIRIDDGNEFNVAAGEGCVMGCGLQPVWTVEDRVKKQWVIVSVPPETN